MQVILGTSVGHIPPVVEYNLAKEYAITLYGSTPKTTEQIKALLGTYNLRTLYHSCDINGWNPDNWEKVYLLWKQIASLSNYRYNRFYSYPCPLFDEVNQKPCPERWRAAEAALKDYLTLEKFSKAIPFVSGTVPIPEGEHTIRMPSRWIMSLDLNAWAILQALAIKAKRTVRGQISALIGQPTNNLILCGYLVKEDGWCDSTWFNAACHKYNIYPSRPPNFRTSDKIKAWMNLVGLQLFQYYESSHLIDDKTGKLGPELEVIAGW